VSARIGLQKPMMACSKFLFLASRGGRLKKILPDIQKKGRKNFSGLKPDKLKVKNFFRTNSC
jgi:hypothetical protein